MSDFVVGLTVGWSLGVVVAPAVADWWVRRMSQKDGSGE